MFIQLIKKLLKIDDSESRISKAIEDDINEYMNRQAEQQAYDDLYQNIDHPKFESPDEKV